MEKRSAHVGKLIRGTPISVIHIPCQIGPNRRKIWRRVANGHLHELLKLLFLVLFPITKAVAIGMDTGDCRH